MIIMVPSDLKSLSRDLSSVLYIFFPLSTVTHWKFNVDKPVCPLTLHGIAYGHILLH